MIEKLQALIATIIAFPVQWVVTHCAPHDDELAALRAAQRWGKKHFPGIEKAKVMLLDAGLRLKCGGDGYSWLKKGFLCIGVAGGTLDDPTKPCIDEHALPENVRKHYSAFTLMAKWLGIEKDPALKPMLAYSLRADVEGKGQPFELANLIKTWHGVQMPIQEVVSIYNTIFDAIYAWYSKTPKVAVTMTFQRIAIRWLIDRFGPKEQGHLFYDAFNTFGDAMEALGLNEVCDDLVQIQVFADRNESNGCRQVYDLSGISVAMQSAGLSMEIVLRLVYRNLDTKYVQQQKFNQAKRDLTAHGSELLERDQTMPYKVIVIRSDNDQMGKAVRKLVPDVDLIIQIRSTGHLRMFSRGTMDLSPIAAHLRMRLWRRAGHTDRLPMEKLMFKGTLEEIPEIFNFKGKFVFNSSNTAPNVRALIAPGKLTESEAIDDITDGLEFIASVREAGEIIRDRRDHARRAARKLVHQPVSEVA